MNSASRLFLFVALFACSTSASAQSLTNLTLADSGAAQLAPRIEHRNGRSYAAYIRARSGSNGDIMFMTRGAGEMTFSAPVAVTNTGKINATLQRGPEFVVAPDGTIHMVWMEQRIANSPDVFYSRGTKHGTEWTQPVDISQDGQIATQDFASIAVDSSGNVYVAWVDNREVPQGKSMNDHIYITRSFNGGMTWDAPRRAEKNPGAIGGSCECCRTAIAASADGDLYIVYRTNMENIRDIFVARSTDKGETFEESIRVQTKEWRINACPATGPMAALDSRENLHMVYRSAANANKAVVFYNLLPKGFDQTFTEMPLTPIWGTTANYADIAVTDSGAISVVYQQSGQIYERASSNGGTYWTPDVPVDSAGSDQGYPIVGSNDATHKLVILWQDDRRDKNDILAQERDFTPPLFLPRVQQFYRIPDGDSLRLSWGPYATPFTWYILRIGDTTIVTRQDSITIPRSLNDHSSILLTPVNSLGRGELQSFGPLEVSFTSPEVKPMLSQHPVIAGEQVSISLNESRQLSWTIYDMQGRNIGTITSEPSVAGHELLMPSLAPGVYRMQCDIMAVGISFIVAAR